MNTRTRVQHANQANYAEPSRVGSYLLDRYHAVRREQAVRAFIDANDARSLPPGPILEIGANGSPLLGSLPDDGRATLVADLSPTALAEYKHGPTAPVVLDADQPLPFADSSQAAIVACELIEHLFDPLGFLREIRRVLHADGVVVLTTPNLAGPQDRLRFLAGRSPRQINPLHEYLHLHIRPFTADLLKRAIVQAGLVPAPLRSNYVGWQLRSGTWLMSRQLAKCFPAWGGSLIVAARKR